MGCGYFKMLATEYTVIFKNALCTQENKRLSSTARKTYSMTIWVVNILHLDSPLEFVLWQ